MDAISNIFKSALPVLETAKGITGTVEQFDPMNIAINAVFDGLGLPSEVKNAAKIAAGAATGNLLLAADGAIGLAQDIGENSGGKTEYWAGESCVKPQGYAPSPQKSAEQIVREQHLDVLWTMEHNWEDLDRGGLIGCVDGKVSITTISEWQCSADPEKRKVGQFFKDHPELLAELDASGGKDGMFTRTDLRATISKVQSEIETGRSSPGQIVRPPEGTPVYGTDPSPNTDARPLPAPPASPVSRGIQDIMKDPNMSVEEKIMAILSLVMAEIDRQLVNTTEKLGAKTKDRVDVADAAQKKDASTEDKHALADTDRGIQELTQDMQSLVQKRNQMFTMMSNISMTFSQMSMTAIQNMGRA